MRTSEQECLAALRDAAEQLGKSPTKAEYEELGLRPASTTILRRFDSWNDAKASAGLEIFEQSDGGGVEIQPKPDWVKLPDEKTWGELTAQQRWYYKNQNRRIDVKEDRRVALKQWYFELKRDELECRRCSEGRAPALDLHHEGKKDRAVSEMVNDGYARERIREEIERCTVLCANCHRREHHDGPDPATQSSLSELETAIRDASGHEARRLRRAWVWAYKRDSGGCSNCPTTHPIALDFHHERDKRMRIGKMVSLDHSLEEIRREIEKCTLLCANCHRDRHFDPPEPAD